MMQLREIDSMEELLRERKRLQKEAEIAKSFFNSSIKNTYAGGVRTVASKLSWPAAISSLAAFGTQKISAGSKAEVANETWITGIRQGVALMQQPNTPQKWFSFIPLVYKLYLKWTSAPPSSPHVMSTEAPPPSSIHSVHQPSESDKTIQALEKVINIESHSY